MRYEQPAPERLAIEDASTHIPGSGHAPREPSVGDLVREVLDESKELVRIEIELAKVEVEKEISQAKKAAVLFGAALATMVLMLCMLSMALVFALGGTALAALGVAAGLLVVSGAAAAIGYSMLPKNPLERTRKRLKSDVNQLKEHVA